MRRVRLLIVAVVALLALTAQPVAAANASAVASEHTTFGTGSAGEPSPTTLQNMSVVGSGAGASVQLSGSGEIFADGFEDEPADSGTADNWSVSVGGFASQNVSTALANSGSQSYYLDTDNYGGAAPSGQPLNTATTKVFRTSLNAKAGAPQVRLFEGGSRLIGVGIRNGDLQVFNGSWSTIATAPDYDEWVSLEITVAPSTDTVTVAWSTASNSGSQSGISTENTISNGYDETWLYVEGSGAAYYDDVSIGGSAPQTGKYVGGAHNAEEVDAGWANLTLSNASAEVTWQEDADNDGVWTNVTSATYTASGNKTASLSAAQSDRWRVYINVTVTGASPAAKLHDEGVLFASASPTISDPVPKDGAKVSEYGGNISVSVNDSDFGLAQNDTVTVTATNASGTTIGATSITANQTVAFPYNATFGANNITWSAADTYQNTNTTAQNFTRPAQLTILNESNISQRVTANVTVRFYFRSANPTVISRQASNGTVNMTGLPAGEPFVVVAEADGYISRRIVVPSLYQQSEIYLLPTNKQHVENLIQVQDYTGVFPADSSVLLIQRGLNGSWETLTGDYFGATNEFSAQLRYNVRHRFVLVNLDTGQRRVIGTYTPIATGTKTVTVTTSGDISVGGRELDVAIRPSTRTLAGRVGESVRVALDVGDVAFTNATITATYLSPNRSTSTTLNSTTVTAGGTHRLGLNLSGRAGGAVRIVVNYSTASIGGTEQATYHIREAFGNTNSLLAVLGTVGPRFPSGHVDAFQAVIVLFTTALGSVLSAARYRVSSELAGLVAVAIIAGWSVIGWVSYDVVFVAGMAFVGFAAIRRGL
jgi:hypothetical protein